MKTKYRVKVEIDGFGERIYIQYKDFLFWHYIYSALSGAPRMYLSVEEAVETVRKLSTKTKVKYINVD